MCGRRRAETGAANGHDMLPPQALSRSVQHCLEGPDGPLLRHCRRHHPRPETSSGTEWRSGRDSTPRYAFGVYSLSRRAPSTTRPPLRTCLERAPLAAGHAAGKRENAGEPSEVVRRNLLAPSVPPSRAAQPASAFCRRRCTEEPMPTASRYLATVRRAPEPDPGSSRTLTKAARNWQRPAMARAPRWVRRALVHGRWRAR